MVHPVCLIILQLFALYCIILLFMIINGEGVFYEIIFNSSLVFQRVCLVLNKLWLCNIKQGQILKIVSFTERGSLTENNGTITNVQLLMVMEIFNFIKNFKNLLMGGHDDKLKNFGKSKKKSLIFTN